MRLKNILFSYWIIIIYFIHYYPCQVINDLSYQQLSSINNQTNTYLLSFQSHIDFEIQRYCYESHKSIIHSNCFFDFHNVSLPIEFIEPIVFHHLQELQLVFVTGEWKSYWNINDNKYKHHISNKGSYLYNKFYNSKVSSYDRHLVIKNLFASFLQIGMISNNIKSKSFAISNNEYGRIIIANKLCNDNLLAWERILPFNSKIIWNEIFHPIDWFAWSPWKSINIDILSIESNDSSNIHITMTLNLKSIIIPLAHESHLLLHEKLIKSSYVSNDDNIGIFQLHKQVIDSR